MDIVPASVDEIAAFKLAAVETYRKAGIDPKTAEALFERTLEGLAVEMGLQKKSDGLMEMAEKLAPAVDDIGLAAVRAIRKKREAVQQTMSDTTDNLANKIAESFGRKRAQAMPSTVPMAQPPAPPAVAPAVPGAPAAPKPKAPVASTARSSNQ